MGFLDKVARRMHAGPGPSRAVNPSASREAYDLEEVGIQTSSVLRCLILDAPTRARTHAPSTEVHHALDPRRESSRPSFTLAAQQPERITLDGREVAIYNLVGKLRVEGGTGDRVVVEVIRGGKDAGRLSSRRAIYAAAWRCASSIRKIASTIRT